MQTTKNDAVPLLGQASGKTLGVLEEQALFNVCRAVTQGLQHPLPQVCEYSDLLPPSNQVILTASNNLPEKNNDTQLYILL